MHAKKAEEWSNFGYYKGTLLLFIQHLLTECQLLARHCFRYLFCMYPGLGIGLSSGTRLFKFFYKCYCHEQTDENSGTFLIFKPVLLSTFGNTEVC